MCVLDQTQGSTGDLLSLRNSSRDRRATKVSVSGALPLGMEVSASTLASHHKDAHIHSADGSNATRKKVPGVAPLSTSIAECRTRQNKTEKTHDLFIQNNFLSSVSGKYCLILCVLKPLTRENRRTAETMNVVAPTPLLKSLGSKISNTETKKNRIY